MTRLRYGVVVAVCSSSFVSGCSSGTVGRGNPGALAPLIGGGARLSRDVIKPPTEPVEDFVADLEALHPAWPAMKVELPRLIRSVIARGSWSDIHHAVSCQQNVLRVRHRPNVIAEVKKLVAELNGRLSRPMHVQVMFVETSATAGSAVFPTEHDGTRRFDRDAFHRAIARKEARTLARALLSAPNGRWSKSERLDNRVVLSGVTVSGGAVIPRTTTLATGATLQAAAWRWGKTRAVVALTGSYTGDASSKITAKQIVHRQLPSDKTTERRWQSHEVEVALPVRELVEVQNTLTVKRAAWSVVALVPREDKTVTGVVVKVDWPQPKTQPATINPLASDRDFTLSIIPIALPRQARPPQLTFANADLGNRARLSDQAAGWFKQRARRSQQEQKRKVYNLQSTSGQLAFGSVEKPGAAVHWRMETQGFSVSKVSGRGPARPPGSGLGAMPPQLEALRKQVLTAKWPEGSALEFVANHVFVVQTPAVAKIVGELLRGTHRFRNRRALTQVAFPRLTPAQADDISESKVSAARAAALAGGPSLRPRAYLMGRGDSHGEIFVGQMHSALASAWPPDLSSPPVHVYWRGVRLAAQPRLGRNGGRAVGLNIKHHRLSRLATSRVAGAVMQQPRDATWSHRATLHLASGEAMLTGVSSTREGLTGLLVTTTWLP